MLALTPDPREYPNPSPNPNQLRKEVCWALSNITAGAPVRVSVRVRVS